MRRSEATRTIQQTFVCVSKRYEPYVDLRTK